MSDFAHGDHRPRLLLGHRTIESRAMYGAFFALFLTRAALKRMVPRRSRAAARVTPRQSIIDEARTAASVLVASSFMGL